MMDDRSFYELRMHEEIRRAEAATDKGLRLLHWRWAGLYKERLDDDARQRRPAVPHNIQAFADPRHAGD